MADLGAGGGVEWGGAGPGREVIAVRETAHVPDVGQDPGRAGGSDSVQVHQTRPGREDGLLQLGFECLESDVESDQVGELVGGQPPHGAPDQIAWAHPGQHVLVLGDGFLDRDPAGD